MSRPGWAGYVIICQMLKEAMKVQKIATYTVITRCPDTGKLALVYPVHVQLLKDGVGRSGAKEEKDREDVCGCELHCHEEPTTSESQCFRASWGIRKLETQFYLARYLSYIFPTVAETNAGKESVPSYASFQRLFR